MLQKLTSFLVTLGPWGVILVSLIDSAGIPIPVGVDALVMYLAWKNPAQAPLNVVLAVIGSTAGSLFLFFAARKGGELFLNKHISARAMRRARVWFDRYGVVCVFATAVAPLPTPMKAFVALSGVFGVAPFLFTAAVVVARTIRYGGEAYLGAQLGEHAGDYLKTHAPHILGAVAALVLLVLLLARLGQRKRHHV